MLFGSKFRLPQFDNIKLILENKNLEQVRVYKYLGVMLDEHLSWATHTDYTAKKISQKIGFLRRSVKPCVPNTTFKLLSSAMVLPSFDYCDVAWSSCTGGKLDRLVKLHNRLARMILNANPRTHIADLHEALSWQSLPTRWHCHRMCEVFKSVNNLNPRYLSSLFTTPAHPIGTRSLTNGSLSVSVAPRTNAAKRTFQYLGTLGWNKLTAAHRQANSLPVFKSLF